jgi:hypothetical protein
MPDAGLSRRGVVMFSQILRFGQCALLILLIVAPATAQDMSQDDEGFVSVGDYPWVDWVGPLSDGLHGCRFGMTGFEVNRILQEKGLKSANARPYTLRFQGHVLGQTAEVIAEFTKAGPSRPGSSLRVMQIRWDFRGLPQHGYSYFQRLEEMLGSRYGTPVLEKDAGVVNLDSGQGTLQRLYYGQQARAWLEFKAIRRQEYVLLIRIECPQLPKPEDAP